jgi:hypothetical protein
MLASTHEWVEAVFHVGPYIGESKVAQKSVTDNNPLPSSGQFIQKFASVRCT